MYSDLEDVHAIGYADARGVVRATYPPAGTEYEVSLPFLAGNKPGTRKNFEGFDLACEGTWTVKFLVDPTDETVELDTTERWRVSNTDGDPHIWLDPARMARIVSLIALHLGTLDPTRATDYARRAGATNTRLKDLHESFREELSTCERRDLVVSHEAFGHLAARYDLEQVGIAGLDPEAEPSPRRLFEVIRFVEENDVTTIFYERQVSPRIAEVIADEAGVTTDVLDPLESPPPTGDYVDAMLANLVCSLIKHKRITTTLAKAKAARSVAEKLVTLCKGGTIHDRRLAVARLLFSG